MTISLRSMPAPRGCLFLTGGRRSAPNSSPAIRATGWRSGRPSRPQCPFDAEDLAYIDLLASTFAHQMELSELDRSLRDAETRARHHSMRLEALWQIANNRSLGDQERMAAMLNEAATTLRANQPFRGLLGRVEDHEIVVIGVGSDRKTGGAQNMPPHIGSRSPLGGTPAASVGRTRCWDDFTLSKDVPAGLKTLEWRSAISTQFEAGGSWYSLTFGSPEATTLTFGTDDFAYLDVLASSFANLLQVSQLEGSLRDEAGRSRAHAERLDALRAIVNNPQLHDQALLQAMLDLGTAALRPSQDYRGILWLVRGDDLIVEVFASSKRGEPLFAVGSVVPIAETVIGTVVGEGRGTCSWDDIQASSDASVLSRKDRARSLLVTTFSAGGSKWGLSFASNEVAREPLGPHDYAYIEVLASFFANHMQQRWQYERIQYQQSHDVLTGLLSRSQFRAQARIATRTNLRYAIILVNIDAFREVNESRGHMIGDAILVEVGNALKARATGDELVGRIEGDVFAIFIPHPVSKELVHERARAFADVFSNVFSTGDAAGTDFIARTGTLGTAVAPEDGAPIDALLSHAGAALLQAKAQGHGSIVAYEVGMEGEALRSTTLRNELAEAIVYDQFELYYQPHVEISTGNVTGVRSVDSMESPDPRLALAKSLHPVRREQRRDRCRRRVGHEKRLCSGERTRDVTAWFSASILTFPGGRPATPPSSRVRRRC